MSSKLMTEAHRTKLLRSRTVLYDSLQITESLLNTLTEDFTLTQELCEEIKSESTSQDKISALLKILPRRPDSSFEQFIKALVRTRQDHIAKQLDSSTALTYITARDKELQTTPVLSQGTTVPMNSWYQRTVLPTNGDVTGYTTVHFMLPSSFDKRQDSAASPYPSIPYFASSYIPVPMTGAASNERVSTAVQEIGQPSKDKDQQMFLEFKAAIEEGGAIMTIDLKPISPADASRILNDEVVYPMTQKVRGRAVIVSNQYFCTSRHQSRAGAEYDEANVFALFTQLGFEAVVYRDKKRDELMTHLKDERDSKDLRSHDAFVMFVMTHGNSGVVFAIDGESIEIDDLTTMFDGNHCEALRGKPKMFFIQACQGTKKSSAYAPDGATNMQPSDDSLPTLSSESYDDPALTSKLAKIAVEDKPGFVPELPTVRDSSHEKAHILISYATVKGYEAWRHSNRGSWYVRSLVYVFCRYAHSSHLLDMLTTVNYLMTKLETEGTKVPYRQVAEKKDTFLKKLYFLPKFSINNGS